MATKLVKAKAKTVAKKPKAKPAATRGGKVRPQGITPFLWYDGNAEEAARFYVSLFEGSKVTSADPMTVSFTLAGQEFIALNGGPHYKPTPAFSILASVKTQEEVDTLWTKLTADGGEESMCGWLVDKFGVSWQIIPTRLMQLIGSKDRAAAGRATQAMLKMRKIDIAALERAAKGK